MASGFLPYGRQSIDDADIAAVADVLRGDYLTTGPAVPALEQAFAAATGAKHAVACSSGTAALHLAAMAAELGEGDCAIVPSVTFLATANAVRFTGAEVVFADVDPETGLLTPDTLLAALVRAGSDGRKVKAVLPVHLGGQCCDMAALGEIASRENALVIEDACHALGGTQGDGSSVGACSLSAMACFSLHPVKTVTSGEGGVVTTNDAKVAEKLALLRNHGMVREPGKLTIEEAAVDRRGENNPWYYEMPEIGFNYRLSDIHAALGSSQLGKLTDFVTRRRNLVDLYDKALAGLEPLIRPVGRLPGQNPAWHLYAVLLDFDRIGLTRAEVMTRLREKGIGTQVHYIPVHRQPYYAERYGVAELPGADAYYARTLSLPLYPGMTDEDVVRVSHTLAEILGGANQR